MEFTCHLPINNLSFGQASLNILTEFYRQGLLPLIIPIGPVDISSFDKPLEGFYPWLQERVNQGIVNHRRSVPTFRLWHIDGSLESISNKQALLTFHETDKITTVETNILRNQSKVLVTSPFTKSVFEESGLENIDYLPLGFDDKHFKKTNKKYHNDDVVYFGLVGKLENRKRHLDVLRLWAKKYGNKPQFFLNCSIYNPHLKPEMQQQLIMQALEGVNYYNINYNPFMDTNTTYNDFLNSNDIIIGMSGGEGWGLPEFQSVCLGKHAVILNASGYTAWANEKNAVLVEPAGKIPCYDNVFFRKGGAFNQGDFFNWTDESLLEAFETAIARYNAGKLNKEGIKLGEDLTWKKTAKQVLKTLKEI